MSPVDLEKLRKGLDNALKKESPETLRKWINEMEKNRGKEKEREIKEKVNKIEKQKGVKKFPCNYLSRHCFNVGAVEVRDINEIIKNAVEGKCDFFYKCKKYREDSCGCNLPPRTCMV